MPKEKVKFLPGDLVFAKLRGFPYWPARILDSFNESGNKYNVLFYGTRDKAVVSYKNVEPFIEKQKQLGKPKSIKGFNLAIAEIKNELKSINKALISDSALSIDRLKACDSLNSNESVCDNDIPKTPPDYGVSDNSASTLKPSFPRVGSVDSEQPSTSGFGKQNIQYNIYDTDESSEGNQENRLFETPAKSFDCSSLINETLTIKSYLQNQTKPNNYDQNNYEFMIGDKQYIIPLKINRPSLLCPESITHWNDLVFQKADEFKQRIFKEHLSQGTINNFNKFTKKENYSKYFRDYKVLKVEKKLIDLELNIRKSCTTEKFDTESVSKYLAYLLFLPLTKLMIKKRSRIIDTLVKLCKYTVVHNDVLSYYEQMRFNFEVDIVKELSAQVLDKIKYLFNLNDDNFMRVISAEAVILKTMTGDLTRKEYSFLTIDPTSCILKDYM